MPNLLFSLFIFVSHSSASLLEIEKQCTLMYKKRLPAQKIKAVCFCVTNNIHQRFQRQQIEELTAIYSRRMGRHEASKSDHLKSMIEFDYFVHSSCQKDPLWRFPKDDLGHPDPISN
jgi:hypothetical protein